MLDEPFDAGLRHGILARGDPELAVDGLDVGPYGARGDVETLRYLRGRQLSDEEAKHSEFALRELTVELPFPCLARAKLPFLALDKLREDAGVGIPLHNGSRLGEHRPGSGAIAAFGAHPRERQQRNESRPGAHTRQARPGRKTSFDCGRALALSPLFGEREPECESCPARWGASFHPKSDHQCPPLSRK